MSRSKRSFFGWLDGLAIPLSVLVRVFLGAYFLRSGINKALVPSNFLKSIHLYDMLPAEPAIFLNATAIVLPWLEILCGIALVVGLFRRGAGLMIAGMLCVFSPAILLRALEMMRVESLSFFDVEFDCGCGTGADIIWIKLSTNAGLLLLSLYMVLSRSDRLSIASLLGAGRESPEPALSE